MIRRRLQLVVLALAALASVATSPPRFPRKYPQWQVTEPKPRQVGCATVELWVSKSGKTGLGVTVKVAKHEAGDTPTPCAVAITRARFVAGGAVADSPPPPPIDMPGLSQVEHRYLPFEFDNNAAWNRGERAGVLTLGFADGTEWSIPLTHVWSGPHDDRYSR